MSNTDESKSKKMEITDASKFMDALQDIVEETVNRVVGCEIKPIKEALNQILVEKEYTITEVAMITGKHHQTIRNWVDEGDLVAYKLGKTWMVKHSALEDFKKKRLENNPYDKIFKTL